LNATNCDNIIIGQEAIYYPDKRTSELGRIKTFSAWSGIVEYVIFQPYMGLEITVKEPERIELIDPRPRILRLRDIFKAR